MEKISEDSEKTEKSMMPITEESLMSLEKLDRASPDLWPEQGMNKFVAQTSPEEELPMWSGNLSNEDMHKLYQLGNLPMNELITKVKELHDLAYQLGLEEAKEMTRGKYLNIFKHK